MPSFKKPIGFKTLNIRKALADICNQIDDLTKPYTLVKETLTEYTLVHNIGVTRYIKNYK